MMYSRCCNGRQQWSSIVCLLLVAVGRQCSALYISYIFELATAEQKSPDAIKHARKLISLICLVLCQTTIVPFFAGLFVLTIVYLALLN